MISLTEDKFLEGAEDTVPFCFLSSILQRWASKTLFELQSRYQSDNPTLKLFLSLLTNTNRFIYVTPHPSPLPIEGKGWGGGDVTLFMSLLLIDSL